MDIVNRIKIFINSLGIGSSQFADNCNISRPTLSQILNGRNKKISDEIISKIHQTYPTLSVVWLMFGEGDMLITENTKISEPKEGEIIDFSAIQNSDSLIITEDNDKKNLVNEFVSENSQGSNLFNFHEKDAPTHQTNITGVQQSQASSEQKSPSGTQSTINIATDKNKKIVSIMIFYSDNSFESFIPSN